LIRPLYIGAFQPKSKAKEKIMGLEITRRKNGSLRSKWWYGNFTVDGKRHYINLGVEIEGNIPESLKELGDVPFERSRMKAHLKLEELKKRSP